MQRSLVTLNDFSWWNSFNDLPKLIQYRCSLFILYGVDQCFTRIVRAQLFVRHLTFGQLCGKSLHHQFTSNEVLNQLCSQVLPSISNQIYRMAVHSSSIKKITEESARSLFTGTTVGFLLKEKRWDLLSGFMCSESFFCWSFSLCLDKLQFLLVVNQEIIENKRMIKWLLNGFLSNDEIDQNLNDLLLLELGLYILWKKSTNWSDLR